MGRSRRKEIEYHLPEEKIDEMLREAEDDDRLRVLASSRTSTKEIQSQKLPTVRGVLQQLEADG